MSPLSKVEAAWTFFSVLVFRTMNKSVTHTPSGKGSRVKIGYPWCHTIFGHNIHGICVERVPGSLPFSCHIRLTSALVCIDDIYVSTMVSLPFTMLNLM